MPDSLKELFQKEQFPQFGWTSLNFIWIALLSYVLRSEHEVIKLQHFYWPAALLQRKLGFLSKHDTQPSVSSLEWSVYSWLVLQIG